MSKKANVKKTNTETIVQDNTNDNRHGYSDDKGGAFIPITPSDNEMPSWYRDFFETIKSKIAVSRRKVMMTANVQMIMMYYRIGKEILARQENEGWGAKIIDRLSFDLKTAFPEQSGFSPRNLICENSPNVGLTKQLCNAPLHNYRGGTTSALWKKSPSQTDDSFMQWHR